MTFLRRSLRKGLRLENVDIFLMPLILSSHLAPTANACSQRPKLFIFEFGPLYRVQVVKKIRRSYSTKLTTPEIGNRPFTPPFCSKVGTL